ncbi:hypothetical protein [Caldilinea sp.]|jgi:hypothetical protein|uniref:hypothetical protein n=1 Tax=Caldilinea sp. TaxID=2293560 RepID=UPI0021DF2943|nr:hypothetical protein [Caldilinea sp.]GIV69353.1 MAG: hypothetical protein KatS3mg048_2215 [Caldilinea sp.]
MTRYTIELQPDGSWAVLRTARRLWLSAGQAACGTSCACWTTEVKEAAGRTSTATKRETIAWNC